MAFQAPPHPAIVFTDLDATLLNESDYAWDGARTALEALRTRNIPVVLASSKTAAEMKPLAEEMSLRAPLICENGGSIGWTDGSSTAVEVDRLTILGELERLRKAGFTFRSFRDLGVEGIAATTGLTHRRAVLALDRHATEPLLFDGDDSAFDAFSQELRHVGLTIIRGGRFFHVAGPIDKSLAMQQVVKWYVEQQSIQPRTLALGDSPNDAKMLMAADHAIVIPDADGQPKINLDHPRLTVAGSAGCFGWGQAVLAWVENHDHLFHQ